MKTAPYGDEAAHFSVTGSLWKIPSIVHEVYFDWDLNYAVIFWQRPMHYLILAPFSSDFTWFRIANMVAAAFIPVLVFVCLRRHVSPLAAFVLASPLVIHPSLVIFGVRGFADTWMAVWVLLALLNANHKWRSAGFLLLAIWTKETAIVALAAFVFWFAWENRNTVRDLERKFLPLGLAIVLAPIPFAISISMGQRFPGWTHGGSPLVMLDAVLGSIWIAPILLVGLWRKWSLPLVLSVSLPLFYGAYAWKTGLAPQGWFTVAVLPLAVIGAGMLFASTRRPMVWASIFAMLLLVPAFAGPGLLRDSVQPFEEGIPLKQGYEVASEEGQDFVALVSFLSEQEMQGLVAVDVGWFFFEYPLSRQAPEFHFSYSHVVDYFGWNETKLTDIMAQPNFLTVLLELPEPSGFHARLLDHYGDCQVAQFGGYRVYEGALCTPYVPVDSS